MNNPIRIAFRIDDIGASTKVYEQYSKRWMGLGNFLFLKRMPYFRAWGPYDEMQKSQWHEVFRVLKKYNGKLTVAVTAAWVESDGSLTPYPQKWPEAFSTLKLGVEQGLIEIACHGLTHCVLQNKAFLPKLFSSNRTFHREFWDWLPDEVHENHIKRAKKILDDAFGVNVTTLVPPGNVFSEKTIRAAKLSGFRLINCMTNNSKKNGLLIQDNENVLAFHDRELVLYGVSWLEDRLKAHSGKEFIFVKDLGAND